MSVLALVRISSSVPGYLLLPSSVVSALVLAARDLSVSIPLRSGPYWFVQNLISSTFHGHIFVSSALSVSVVSVLLLYALMRATMLLVRWLLRSSFRILRTVMSLFPLRILVRLWRFL